MFHENNFSVCNIGMASVVSGGISTRQLSTRNKAQFTVWLLGWKINPDFAYRAVLCAILHLGTLALRKDRARYVKTKGVCFLSTKTQ